MYNGQIKITKTKFKKKLNWRELNWKSLLLWYIGILVSFLPIGIDIVALLPTHCCFGREYLIKLCLKGDLLWTFAVIIVLTIIDYVGENAKKKWGNLALISVIAGIILWGISSVLWCMFRYVYQEYDGIFPIIISLVIGGLTLLFCSPLQIKKTR